jgi:hypothetical protein
MVDWLTGVYAEGASTYIKFAAFIGMEPWFTVTYAHAVNVYPERLAVPLEGQRGITSEMPRVSLFADASAIAIDTAKEWLPVRKCDVLTVILVIPLIDSVGSCFQPSTVPDSNPQFMQLAPVVHVTGLAPW